MRVVLPIALVLLQVLLPLHLSSASVNLTEIATPTAFPTFSLPADAGGWVSDLTTCDLVMQRVTHAGAEVYSLTFQQPTWAQCSDNWSLNWTVVRDRLAVWLNASGSDAISNFASGLNVSGALSKDLSWTVQGLVSESQGGTQTMLQYSPSADWYVRGFVSGWSSGDGTSFTTQQVQVGYQGLAGPQVSVTLARQLFGIAEFDTTIFTLGTSFHDLSAQFSYKTMTMTMSEFSAVQTLHYPALSLTFPINRWWWTVSGMMGDVSNVMVTFSREDSNLSGELSLAPLGFGLSYKTKF